MGGSLIARRINSAGKFDGSQTSLNGLLIAAVVEVYLASIHQRPDLQGLVSVTLSNG
jgi:hypothetical protein